jgi:hypothetical protein
MLRLQVRRRLRRSASPDVEGCVSSEIGALFCGEREQEIHNLARAIRGVGVSPVGDPPVRINVERRMQGTCAPMMLPPGYLRVIGEALRPLGLLPVDVQPDGVLSRRHAGAVLRLVARAVNGSQRRRSGSQRGLPGGAADRRRATALPSGG